jgi:hypothetical protein
MQAANIFWQVAGYVAVGPGAHVEGIIICKTAVTMKTKSSINGRILAQTAVALQMTTIVESNLMSSAAITAYATGSASLVSKTNAVDYQSKDVISVIPDGNENQFDIASLILGTVAAVAVLCALLAFVSSTCTCRERFFTTAFGCHYDAVKTAQREKMNERNTPKPSNLSTAWANMESSADAAQVETVQSVGAESTFGGWRVLFVETLINHVVFGAMLAPSCSAFHALVLFVTMLTNMCVCAFALDGQVIMLVLAVSIFASAQKSLLFAAFARVQNSFPAFAFSLSPSDRRLTIALVAGFLIVSTFYTIVSVTLGLNFMGAQDIMLPFLSRFGLTFLLSCFAIDPLVSLGRAAFAKPAQAQRITKQAADAPLGFGTVKVAPMTAIALA